MRTIGEIQAAVQADLEGSILALSSDELRLCVESQRILVESLRDALEALVSAICYSKCLSDLELSSELATAMCLEADKALDVEPGRWLERSETGPKTPFDPKTPG